jgi:hypothetical protein
LTFDNNSNKVVVAYKDGGNSDYSTSKVGTVSGMSISFGSASVFTSASSYGHIMEFDSTNNKVIVLYRIDTGLPGAGQPNIIFGTVSGTSINFDTAVTLNTLNLFGSYKVALTYDSSNDKSVFVYQDVGNSNFGTALTFSPSTLASNLTAENFIGISDGAYTNGQTATVQIVGAIDDAQSGLTAARSYYVQNDGTLGLTPDSPSVFAGTAVSDTQLIIKG